MLFYLKYILLFLYALVSICSLHIANCDSLSNVTVPDITDLSRPSDWGVLLGSALFIGFILFIIPNPADPTILPHIIVAPLPTDSLKDINYLKALEYITKFPK